MSKHTLLRFFAALLLLLPAFTQRSAADAVIDSLRLGNTGRMPVFYQSLTATDGPSGAAIVVPATTMQLYRGCRLTDVYVYVYETGDGGPFRVFLSHEPGGEPVAEQTFAPEAFRWNRVTLAEPYEPDGRALCIGYEGGGLTLLPCVEPAGDGEEWFSSGGAWQRLDQPYGAALYAVMRGDLPRDNVRLIRSLEELRDAGNTVVVVEHDRDMMLAADYIIDMGPRAGRHGGEVVFQGTPRVMMEQHTLTADYLNGRVAIAVPAQRRKGNGAHLRLTGATGNNLKGATADFPLGTLICVTGVSGSGKSTLVNDTLLPILSQHLYRSLRAPLPYKKITGLDLVDKVVAVDQSPLGRTPRSNPATYTGVFADIRSLFVNLPEAKMRGYKPGRFSFNVKGGRCETCKGNGYKTIEMNFLPDVYVPCETCHGKRYNHETLEVRFKGKSIADVLDMTINQAVEFFENVPAIQHKIKVLQDVGLGYIKLGQSSTTLSGGESQRVKLATELSRRDTGRTIYILDEPTTGLHFEDIRVLLGVLNRLVDKGNTVIVIEHNLDVIKCADYIIDMGPEGGRGGGRVVACGTPEEVVRRGKGYTARFLGPELESARRP